MEDRENVYGTYMEHRPLLTAGQEMDHWARNHDGGTVMIVVETTMLQFWLLEEQIEDWRKEKNGPKKGTLGLDTKIVPRPKWKFEHFNLETETAFYISRHLFWIIAIKEQI